MSNWIKEYICAGLKCFRQIDLFPFIVVTGVKTRCTARYKIIDEGKIRINETMTSLENKWII